MNEMLREPLVHFLLIGLVLFGLYALIGDDAGVDETRIEITDAVVAQLQAGWQKTWQRPPTDIPLALFSFNIGVELGQLLFIAAVFVVIALLKRLRVAWPGWAELLPAYSIGSLAAFWCIQRVAGF